MPQTRDAIHPCVLGGLCGDKFKGRGLLAFAVRRPLPENVQMNSLDRRQLLTPGYLTTTIVSLVLIMTATSPMLGESLQISRVDLPVAPGEKATCVSLPEDGQLIAFSSDRPGGYGANDIWFSRLENGAWSKPFNPGRSINSEKNEFDGRFSPDGSTLLFIRGEVDLWKSNSSRIHSARLAVSGWTKARPFPQNVSPPDTIELAACLTTDGKKVYFSSNREGGFGKYDHYYTELVGGRWSEPINLGPAINTAEDEIDLTIGPDGDSLVFPAHRQDSIANSHDLYISRRTEGQWTQPVNMGPRINTPGNDTCPWLAFDGVTLFLNSDWDGLIEGKKGRRLIWRIYSSEGF